MSLANAPAVEDLLPLTSSAHRSVAHGGHDPHEAWLVLVRLGSGWSLYGSRANEREARKVAHAQQYRTAGRYAVLKYSDLAAYDERVLREAKERR